MSQRRFSDKPDLDPSAVMALSPAHPAMIENRTLFPSTVVTVDDTFEDRLLVSGANSRKLGKTVEKGRFRGYEIYSLTLEERATCPATCGLRDVCYGNSMHLARRHRIGDLDVFAVLIEDEIREILQSGAPGVLIRLHVLGDFPSVEYVSMWSDILDEHPNVAVFGFTHWAPEIDPIGDAIEALRVRFGERFRIRPSLDFDADIDFDAAFVLDHIPDGAKVGNAAVCPAQTQASACCATCAYCWESEKPVAFIRHGRAIAAQAASVSMPEQSGDQTRPINPIALPRGVTPGIIAETEMEVRFVLPSDLRVEAKYQRDLTGKSISLIRRIVAEFDWAKFKPPVCSETDDGLFIIDGQHTAIAAATHPDVEKIPVIIVSGRDLGERAGAFVSHNRDRVGMTPYDIFHAEIAAGIGNARMIAKIVEETGCMVPRSQPSRMDAKPGQISAVNEIKAIYAGAGPAMLRRVLAICAKAGLAPITTKPLRALRRMFEHGAYPWARPLSNDEIAAAMASIPNIDLAARAHATKTGQDVQRACIMLIRDALGERAA